MKISYTWLKWYVPEIPEADKLADIFTYHLAEVENVEKNADGDTIFDINILPNRAHDLLSHLGIAREVCGQLGIAFSDPAPGYKIPESKKTDLTIDIQTPLCRRYMARIVRNVKVGPSPEWVVRHLESIGQRSINNIVDATNLVMFDCGQPAHAFDLRKIKNQNEKIKIVIRNAHAEEKMTTLDGKEVTLRAEDLVVTDCSEVLALAGVKGGTEAEIDENTTDILLEIANFDPVAVRKTARRLSLLTDSAKRFENDLSAEIGPDAMIELSALILEMFPEALFEDAVDVYPNPQKKRTLVFTLAEVNKKLGADISSEETEKILKNYSYSYTKTGDEFVLDVPPLRLDLVNVEDMTEELARVRGYDKIQPEIPNIASVFIPKVNETHARIVAAREKLLSDGYSEVMTYTFAKKGKVEVARGAKGKEFLRTNLSDGLKISYEENQLNAALLGEDELKIFEIGTVFPLLGEEKIHVAFADKKAVTETALEEFAEGTGSVIPDPDPESMSYENTAWIPDQVEDDTKKQIGDDTNAKKTSFKMWSPYPFITRDVAVWVPAGTDPDVLISLCQKEGTSLLARPPRLFDQFEKDGRVSLALRLVFQSSERTLTDSEVSEIMKKIDAEIALSGFEIR